MDRGAWRATVHGAANRHKGLTNTQTHTHTHTHAEVINKSQFITWLGGKSLSRLGLREHESKRIEDRIYKPV